MSQALPVTGTFGVGFDIDHSTQLRRDGQRGFTAKNVLADLGNAGRRKLSFGAWVRRPANAHSEEGGGIGIQCLISNRFNGVLDRSNLSVASGDVIQFFERTSGATSCQISWQLAVDHFEWAHWFLVLNSEEATQTERIKLYVNGELMPRTTTTTDVPLNYEFQLLDTTFSPVLHIGHRAFSPSNDEWWDGYMTHLAFLGGQVLGPEAFGEVKSSRWVPKSPANLPWAAGSFLLAFNDSGDLGKDSSGQGFDFNAINSPSQVKDSPSDSYPLLSLGSTGGQSWQGRGAGLDHLSTAVPTGYVNTALATIRLPSTGRWYWEGTHNFSGSSLTCMGVTRAFNRKYSGTTGGTRSPDVGVYGNGDVKNRDAVIATLPGNFLNTERCGILVDMSARPRTLQVYKAGATFGSAVALDSYVGGEDMPLCICVGTKSSRYVAHDFGQISTSVPSGANAKLLKNSAIPSPPNALPSRYLGMATYVGDAVDDREIDLGLSASLVWVKRRDSAHHILHDVERGDNYILRTSNTDAQTFETNMVKTITPTGYRVGMSGQVNGSGNNYVALGWQANPDAGFQIFRYNGNGAAARVLTHGLGRPPEFIIGKRIDATDFWVVGHRWMNAGTNDFDYWSRMDNTARINSANGFNNTYPTDTELTVGIGLNVSGGDYIVYAWAPVEGFSQFGTLIGNGNANGPEAMLNFRPGVVFSKRVDAGQHWQWVDSKRNPYNRVSANLELGRNTAEVSRDVLFKASGFKENSTAAQRNTDLGHYVYAAWAEQSFNNARAY